MITMNKNSVDLIQKFATTLDLTISQFIESVCCSHIISVVRSAENERNKLKEKMKNAKTKN